MSTRVAIVGAGIAGLVAARALQDQHEVVIFEKSRGVGGRVATRQHEDFFFDHGAQFFSAKTDAFQRFLQPYLEREIVQVWKGKFQERNVDDILSERQWVDEPAHYVGVPTMNAFPKAIAEGLNIHRNTRIVRIEKQADHWCLITEDGVQHANFDWVILAIPVAQVRTLLPESLPFASELQSIEMQACYSLMLGFAAPLSIEFDAALIHGADISWISVNSSKPGRDTHPTLLIHSTNRWAEAHVALPREQVIEHLLHETTAQVGSVIRQAVHVDLQRWLYANAEKRVDADPCFIDRSQRIIASGDWCIHGRIEAAFLSGQAAAAAIME